MDELIRKNLYSNIKELINSSRVKIVQAINTTMVYTYFEIGRLKVEHLQSGNDCSDYGIQVLKSLSESLAKEFGDGFSKRNLQRMKNFYQEYSISPTLSSKFNKKNLRCYDQIDELNKFF
ncbi:hypothetical protein KA062_03130 [Patescibacteria group bacterium]|nr:hypothetical protein [Patescibacteria group bacterium]